jgi:hypothetical protein
MEIFLFSNLVVLFIIESKYEQTIKRMGRNEEGLMEVMVKMVLEDGGSNPKVGVFND